MVANAVELTVEQAWYVADTLGAGSFPWVLAITQPFSDPAARRGFTSERVAELAQLGVLTDDNDINPAVAR
ncbi:ESX secretion-associated protein EspG, partial [Micromonospora sp. WMMD736]|uniref:ESX secretion-associated protein EspG n=1 Tax=Micromonospora sp. WMMD736 TaxID=3404112 RepID=UPI003B922754